jgi:trehalose 6-phosphate phosphatase
MSGDPAAGQIARLAARPERAAISLDFDGTIAPIVDDPAAARPLPGVVDLLGPLADRYAAVALVSGRPATYLASHAAAPGVRYLGMYGLEEIVEGRVLVDPRLEAAQPAVAAARRDLEADPAVTACGAHIEDKRYSVAVHTRRVADPGRWAGPIAEAAARIAARHGLEVVPGKMVWELRPRVRSDKGHAVRRVVAESGARSMLVAGDDIGDLPAFAFVRRWRARTGRPGVTIGVVTDAASPIAGQADWELRDTADLTCTLRALGR